MSRSSICIASEPTPIPGGHCRSLRTTSRAATWPRRVQYE
jgi:hypothetical protein